MDIIPVLDSLSKLDPELANKIYDDLFSPWMKKAWEWLGNVLWLIPTITLPFALLNNYSNYILKKNIAKLENKLENVKKENITPVRPEIWVPLLEKLAYYDCDILVDMFTTLLKNWIDKTTVYKVHPRFIKIVEYLSEDDAIILEYLSKQENSWYTIPCLDVYLKVWSWSIQLERNRVILDKNIKLNNQLWVHFCIENLKSLWIIEIEENEYSNISYDEVINCRQWEIIAWTKSILNDDFIYKKKTISVTPLWQEFLKIVFKWK